MGPLERAFAAAPRHAIGTPLPRAARHAPPRHARQKAPVRTLGSLVAGVLVGPLALTVLLTGGTTDAAFATAVTVRTGDTLSAMALRYHTTVAALAAANGITDPNRIVAGATVQVPSAPVSAQPAPAPPASPSPPSPPSAPAAGTVVTVRTGDTLSSIAARYHTTVAALVSANKLANPNLVFAGSRLTLPGPALPPGWSPGGPVPAALVAHPERLALRPAFVRAAGASSVAPNLLEALCWWESGWVATATSSAGAIGVCQLEPSTVNYARTVLLHNPALDPRNAADNITMAAAYLHDLTVRDGGDVRMAVAAYYQGLSSIQRKGLLPSTQTYVTGIFNYTAFFAAAG
jgi:LysM repeat protein